MAWVGREARRELPDYIAAWGRRMGLWVQGRGVRLLGGAVWDNEVVRWGGAAGLRSATLNLSSSSATFQPPRTRG